jgi:AcrR family transcriptional regulator
MTPMAAVSTPPGLRDAKRHVVKEVLWHAALELFDAQGYNRTTVEEIAEKAGVSRRTFFRYFSSKDEIVVFATDAYGDWIVQAIQPCTRQGPPIEIVRAAVTCVAEFVVAQPRPSDPDKREPGEPDTIPDTPPSEPPPVPVRDPPAPEPVRDPPPPGQPPGPYVSNRYGAERTRSSRHLAVSSVSGPAAAA